ncbi:MAG: 30S ribosomal protein S15 [Nanoarchaeota archaeon]|nr:30S ribosomal protein S15 [Nanoarchaeota archaeon]
MQQQKTDWVKTKPEEIEKEIIELAKKGTPPEKIGLIIRDQHGIPKVKIFGTKTKKILERAGLWEDSEYNNANKKIIALRKHLEKNKHDYTSKRSLVKYTARLNKLKKLANK